MSTRPMRRDERCLDCDEALASHEGHGGDPGESYDEGFHICGKRNPRVVPWIPAPSPGSPETTKP